MSETCEKCGNVLSSPLARLSEREVTVLELMASGRSNQGIACALWITEGTVEKHVRSIFSKLAIPGSPLDHRRVLAVLEWLKYRAAAEIHEVEMEGALWSSRMGRSTV